MLIGCTLAAPGPGTPPSPPLGGCRGSSGFRGSSFMLSLRSKPPERIVFLQFFLRLLQRAVTPPRAKAARVGDPGAQRASRLARHSNPPQASTLRQYSEA